MTTRQRGNRLEGADAVALAWWQARTFPTRAQRPTPFHDELPLDLFADRAATRLAIARASGK